MKFLKLLLSGLVAVVSFAQTNITIQAPAGDWSSVIGVESDLTVDWSKVSVGNMTIVRLLSKHGILTTKLSKTKADAKWCVVRIKGKYPACFIDKHGIVPPHLEHVNHAAVVEVETDNRISAEQATGILYSAHFMICQRATLCGDGQLVLNGVTY